MSVNRMEREYLLNEIRKCPNQWDYDHLERYTNEGLKKVLEVLRA